MAELRLAASITIQRFARGLMVRRWYVKHFDQRACCTCNSLADTEVIVCSDCYEVLNSEPLLPIMQTDTSLDKIGLLVLLPKIQLELILASD